MDDLLVFKDLGVAAAALLIMFQFSKWMAENAFKQLERAQAQLVENNQKMFEFMDTTFKENTQAIHEMVSILREHVRSKDEALELLKLRR